MNNRILLFAYLDLQHRTFPYFRTSVASFVAQSQALNLTSKALRSKTLESKSLDSKALGSKALKCEVLKSR